jgi:hypothetical protein
MPPHRASVYLHCSGVLLPVLQIADASSAGSLPWSVTSSSPSRTSSVGTELLHKQQHAAALAGISIRSRTSSSWGLEVPSRRAEHSVGGAGPSATPCGDVSPLLQGQHNAQCTPVNAAAGGSSAATTRASSCTPLNLDAVGLLASPQRSAAQAVAGIGSVGGAAGNEAQRLLVDMLLRQRGGRAYALAQLDELDGSQASLPLQLEVRACKGCWVAGGCNIACLWQG